MKLSRNGQVSIPAAARKRWDTDQMIVVDLGDRVVIRPMPADGRASLRGKYAGRGPTTDEMRAQARVEEAEREGIGVHPLPDSHGRTWTAPVS